MSSSQTTFCLEVGEMFCLIQQHKIAVNYLGGFLPETPAAKESTPTTTERTAAPPGKPINFQFRLIKSTSVSSTWVMVVGGYTRVEIPDVELISLDPEGNPVPECLKRLKNLRSHLFRARGVALSGNSQSLGNLP